MAVRLPASRAVGSVTRPVINTASVVHDQLAMFGQILFFVFDVVTSIPYVLRHFRREIWRLLAEVTFCGGMLAVAASTVVVSSNESISFCVRATIPSRIDAGGLKPCTSPTA